MIAGRDHLVVVDVEPPPRGFVAILYWSVVEHRVIVKLEPE